MISPRAKEIRESLPPGDVFLVNERTGKVMRQYGAGHWAESSRTEMAKVRRENKRA